MAADDDADRDDDDDLRAPIVDETTAGMRRRLDRLERWRIAADIMIKDNNHMLIAIGAHITSEFKDQNEDIKKRFEKLHDKLEDVISDQKTWQVVRNVFKWIAIAMGPIIGAIWAVSTFVYEHYHHNGVK